MSDGWTVTVERWEGALPLASYPLADAPRDRVARILVQRNGQTVPLQGFDHYWLAGGYRFGVFNDPANHWGWWARLHGQEPYRGARSITYDWHGDEPVIVPGASTPSDALVFDGCWVPEPHASEAGLS